MNDKISFLKFFFEPGKYSEESTTEKIADFFPALIYIYDVESQQLSYTNRRFKDFFGLNRENFTDAQSIIDDIVFREDLSLVRKEIEKFYELKDEESYCFNCRFNHQKENWRYFKTSGTVLRRNAKGKPRSLLFIAQDITDQMKNQEEIQTMNQLFNETEELLQYGSWSWEPDSGKVTWTNGLYRMLGYEKDELGKDITTDHFMQHVLPDFADSLWKEFTDSIAEKRDFNYEFKVRTKSGEIKTVATNGKVVIDSMGNAVKMLGIMRDITELRHFEREQERNLRELNRSNKELEEFAYVASHDLQEPLRKIAMFSERLRSKYGEALDKEAQLFMDRILVSAGNMRTLIDNLLEFSRANRSSQAFTKLDLKTIIDQVMANLELKIEETRAKVILETALPVIDAVPSEMEQLFSNLISNAIKFRKPAEDPQITITTRKATREEKQEHHLSPDKQYYRVDVKDNGIGFEEEYSEKIFQIFQRLHGKAEYPGSGIGLAICKRIVDNHNGVIFANGLPDHGSTFTVLLPEKQF